MRLSYLSKDKICVTLDEGDECEISRNAWDVVRYTVDGEGPDATFKRTVAGRYIQYPIKLAWAVTIHKSQGQTFSKVNLNPSCWDSGQLYVALSRVKSIDGLHLTAPIYNRYLALDPAVEEFYNRTQEPDDAGIARGMDYKEEPVKKAAPAEDGPEQIGLFWSMQQEGPT